MKLVTPNAVIPPQTFDLIRCSLNLSTRCYLETLDQHRPWRNCRLLSWNEIQIHIDGLVLLFLHQLFLCGSWFLVTRSIFRIQATVTCFRMIYTLPVLACGWFRVLQLLIVFICLISYIIFFELCWQRLIGSPHWFLARSYYSRCHRSDWRIVRSYNRRRRIFIKKRRILESKHMCWNTYSFDVILRDGVWLCLEGLRIFLSSDCFLSG